MTGHREISDSASPLPHLAASAEKDCVPTGGLAEFGSAPLTWPAGFQGGGGERERS